MTNPQTPPTKRTGFTVVELTIAIVVIGILASIVLATFPGYQAQTRDTKRKSDVTQVVAALSTYIIQNNNAIESGSGCGVNGNGNGWLDAGPADIATYPKSIISCLQSANTLTSATSFVDPSGCVRDSSATCGVYNSTPVKAYMKVTCTKGGVASTYVLAYLETQPQKKAEVDGLCDPNTVNGFTSTTQQWGTYYGMNYYVRVR